MIWTDDINESTRKRLKQAERQRKIDNGEAVSDSSSTKEFKLKQKEKYLAKMKAETMTS